MEETEKIKERYKRRKKLPEDFYSVFKAGNLFIFQEKEREVLRLLKKYGMQYLKDKKILDVGCGKGGGLRDFIRWGAKPKNLYGIDLLKESIKKAKEISPNINFACGNAKKLDFPDKHFDIVLQSTCFTSIFNSQMKKNIVKEMFRVVKDNGIILWYDFKYDNPKNPDVHGIKKHEIKLLFPNCYYDFNLITLAPPIVRKLALISWLACYFLTKLKLLNTHYLVIIRKK